MPTITITATTCRAGTAAASGSYYNISSSSNMNGVSTPKATNITWTMPRPASVPWAACKITAVYAKNIRVYNSSDAVKDASWLFRTSYQSSTWNGNLAYVNGNAVWRYKGMNNGAWHPANTTTTYNNVSMTADALTWVQQELAAGRDLYFSYVEARSTNQGSTYSTRFYINYIPQLVITYEITSNIKYWDGSNWNTVIPYYAVDASKISQSTLTRPNGAMTAATSQNCTASSSSNFSADFPAWRAFDDSTTTNAWASTRGVTSAWLMLKMPEPLYNISVTMVNRQDHATLSNGPISGVIQGSNDGTTFTDLKTFSGRDGKTKGASSTISCGNNNKAYQYVRIYTENWDKTSDTSKTECCIGDCSITGTQYPTSGIYFMKCLARYWDGTAWQQV